MTSIIDPNYPIQGGNIPLAVPVEESAVVIAIPYYPPQPPDVVVQHGFAESQERPAVMTHTDLKQTVDDSCHVPCWVPCCLCSFALLSCPPNQEDCCYTPCCSCTCKCCDCCDSRGSNYYCYVSPNTSNNNSCCCCFDCSGCDCSGCDCSGCDCSGCDCDCNC